MSKLASFLVGMGGGYLKADRQRSEDERRAKLDARDQQLHDARMQDILATQAARQEDVDFKAANRVAMSAGKTDGGYQITDAAGSNAFTKDADAAAVLGDMAAAKNTDVQNNAATRVSTGRAGATMQGTVAGNQVFQDPAKAQEFAKTQAMSDWAKMKARQEVAEEFGKMDLSDDLRVKLLKLESEGAFNAYRLAANGDYEGAAKVYQSTGKNRLPEGAFFTSAEVEDPATKIRRRVVSVMGKDGQPIVPDLDQALRTYLSPSERYMMEKGDRDHTLNERKISVAEKNAALSERKLDGMLTGLIGGGRGGGSGSQNGINSDAIDGYLVPNLGSVNAEGTKVPANPAVINLVRSVAFQLPQAVTDPKGAAYTAHIAWTKALTAAGGDEQKASALLQQALQPAAPAQAVPPANQEPSPPAKLPPPAKKVTMQSTVNTPTYTKWMQAKSARDDLLSKASKMSKESAAVYLQARLPQIEAVIKANENYQVQ